MIVGSQCICIHAWTILDNEWIMTLHYETCFKIEQYYIRSLKWVSDSTLRGMKVKKKKK